MKKSTVLALVFLPLPTLAALSAGGWAVVSVEDSPEYLVVGKPTALAFQVRQHGSNPLGGLTPRIEAQSGSKRIQGRVWETPTEGTYRASITIPERGAWTLTINPNFGKSRGQLLPLQAVDATQRVAAVGDAERGRLTFAARGCVSCHVHRAVDIKPEISNVGPDLSDRRFAAQYLAQFLADPSIKPASGNTMQMPNLGLKPREIAALVAFINGPEGRVSSVR
jgi:cytochrome c551/c552